MKHSMNSTYLRLAAALRFDIVYPIVIFSCIGIMSFVFRDLLNHTMLFVAGMSCFLVAFLANKGMGNNPILGKLFDFFVFLESPNHLSDKAGVAYVLLFFAMGIVMLIAQMLYWTYLFFT